MSSKRFPKQTEIKKFFSKVSPAIHELNTKKQFIVDSERQKQEAEDKKKADADKTAAKDEEKRQATERIIQKRQELRQELIDVNNANREVAKFMGDHEVLQMYANIDNAVEVALDVSGVKRKKAKKLWTKRPPNWKDITEHYQNYGLESVQLCFPEELAEIPQQVKNSLQRTLSGWVKDVQTGKEPGYAHRQPGYIFFD
jgi:hypothetical protein